MSAPGGVSALGRVGTPGEGVCCQGGVVSQHALRQTPPPPVNRMTNRCKNITLATTSLRPVKVKMYTGSRLLRVRLVRALSYVYKVRLQ